MKIKRGKHMYKVDLYSCLYNCPNSKRGTYRGGKLNGQIGQCCDYMKEMDLKKDIVLCRVEKNHPLEKIKEKKC